MRKHVGLVGAVVVSAACALAIAGCGSRSKSGQTSTSGSEATSQAAQSVEETTSAVPSSKYAVTIDGARLISDYEGKPAVAVDYTFTNVSDEDATSMAVALNAEVYQGGTECEMAFTVDEDTGGYMKKVKAGASVPVTMVYALNDTTTEVEVEVKELFSWDDTVLAHEVFSLSAE